MVRPRSGPMYVLLASAYLLGTSSYVLMPILPIYLTEPIHAGGLAWSKSDTFSLFGTFLALLYIAPCLGGLVGDYLFGRAKTAIVGTILTAVGTAVLSMSTEYSPVYWSTAAIALGVGSTKVSIASSIGRLPQDLRRVGYEYHYITSCLGFVSGGLIANPLFELYGIHGIALTSLLGTLAGAICLMVPFRAGPTEENPTEEITSKDQTGQNGQLFGLLLALGVPFFMCSSQLATSVPLFIHRSVPRTIGSWTVPTLWFGALGSLSMIALSPHIRNAWRTTDPPQEQIESYGKYIMGFALSSVSFAACTAMAAFPTFLGTTLSLFLLYVLHLSCFIADLHVRPVLFRSATALMPTRVHMISTAAVYGCIGLGGKLAGWLSTYIDQIGFPAVFAVVSTIAALACWVTLYLHRRAMSASPAAEAVKEGGGRAGPGHGPPRSGVLEGQFSGMEA